MIGMMYLVLTALLALNISKEVLNGFVKVENSLISTQQTLADKVDETYSSLKAKYLNNQEKVGPFYEKADVISIHLPLTPKTQNLLNYDAFIKMQKQPIIINSSRGSIINEHDLLKAYDEKLISGFALDVYETEPAPKIFLNSIKDNTNCILTPHIAGVTKESNIRVSDFIANSVKEFFKL